MASTPTYVCVIDNVAHPELNSKALCEDMGGVWTVVRPAPDNHVCLIGSVEHPEITSKAACEAAGGTWTIMKSTQPKKTGT